MLCLVVCLVDGTFESGLAELYGSQWQLIVWGYIWREPYDAAALKRPVAERNDDIVVLQTLALVYGYKPYSVYIVALDGLCAHILVPLAKHVL